MGLEDFEGMAACGGGGELEELVWLDVALPMEDLEDLIFQHNMRSDLWSLPRTEEIERCCSLSVYVRF